MGIPSCSLSHPSSALPAVLPLIFDSSLLPRAREAEAGNVGCCQMAQNAASVILYQKKITAESLSLIKRPGHILHGPAGQPHPLATGGEATGAGDMGRMVAEGGLDGERIGWTLQQWGGGVATSLGLSCVVPAPALCFPWDIGGGQLTSGSEEVDVSPLVGFPDLGKTAQLCQATLWAADVLLLEVVVKRQRVRGAPNPRGWVEHPPNPCTPQAGDAVGASRKRERARRETEAGRRVPPGSGRSSGMLVRVRSRV